MMDPGIIDYRLLTDPELAAVVLQLRKDKGWTQETLAELARVSTRTVQRLEDGQGCSGETRRAIAGAFEFSDLDTFSKPWPLPNIEKLKAESARIERETIAVAVEHLAKGRQVRELAERCDSSLITSTDDATDEVELLMGELRELFTEYGDCHDLYDTAGKLDVNRQFQEIIDMLAALGAGLAGGHRRVRMKFRDMPVDDPGVYLDVIYILSGPVGAIPASIRVPREGRFGF